MLRKLVVAGCMIALAGCGGTEKPEARVDSATRRQRDSAVGASGLPGATGVTRAMEDADSARARQALLDSMNKQP